MILWRPLSLFWLGEIGSPLDDGIWFLPMAAIGKEQVALYYAFDNSSVTLLTIASV